MGVKEQKYEQIKALLILQGSIIRMAAKTGLKYQNKFYNNISNIEAYLFLENMNFVHITV